MFNVYVYLWKRHLKTSSTKLHLKTTTLQNFLWKLLLKASSQKLPLKTSFEKLPAKFSSVDIFILLQFQTGKKLYQLLWKARASLYNGGPNTGQSLKPYCGDVHRVSGCPVMLRGAKTVRLIAVVFPVWCRAFDTTKKNIRKHDKQKITLISRELSLWNSL